MSTNYSKQTLEFTSSFQNKAQNIKRYEGNPYVEGDTIAEHLSRLARMLICITSDLRKEFPEQSNLIEDIFTCLMVHDDDEVIDGFDIPTALKNHNIKDEEEILKFQHSINELSKDTQEHLLFAFTSFRKKNTLAAQIAKALDNIVGNQLVIEQEVGLINPDQAKFAIEYVEKVRGISKTTDSLIDAQVTQIIEGRERLKKTSKQEGVSEEKIKELLEVDILSHILNKEKINTPLNQL
jgi:5'-deoxynucleotidase YfbR-like HD superfamily hydrolase